MSHTDIENALAVFDQSEIDRSREQFLGRVVGALSHALETVFGEDDTKAFVTAVGTQVGREWNAEYRQAVGATALDPAQVAAALVDLKSRIDGEFEVQSIEKDRIVLCNSRCPFGDNVEGKPSMCQMTSSVFGRIVADNLGYARISIPESIAKGDASCRVVVDLEETGADGANYDEYFQGVDPATSAGCQAASPGVRAAISAELGKRSRERETALREQRTARRMAAMNDNLQRFAHAAAHDMREPIRIISTLSDALLNHGDEFPAERRQKFLERIHSHARRADQLVHDVLEFAAIGESPPNCVSFELSALLREVWTEVEMTLPQEVGAELTVDFEGEIQGDRRQLATVFRNLLSNAAKFRGDKPVQIDVTLQRCDGYDKIVVRDQGEGFDEEYAEVIFSAFKRLHNKDEISGSGMGLAICRSILGAHEGTISARAEPGEGAEFFVNLPANPAGPDVSAEEAAPNDVQATQPSQRDLIDA